MKLSEFSSVSMVKGFIQTGLAISSIVVVSSALANEIKVEKAKPYLLKTCLVTGEKLNSGMGEPYVFEHKGRQIKLCCKGCIKDFNKEPAKFIKKLEMAEKAAKDVQRPAAADQDSSQHQHEKDRKD